MPDSPGRDEEWIKINITLLTTDLHGFYTGFHEVKHLVKYSTRNKK
jgi:hypothetical protein